MLATRWHFSVIPPSQVDTVLIQYLDGGKRPDTAFEAGSRPLASSIGEGGEEEGEEGDEEEAGCSSSSAASSDLEIYEQTHSPAMPPKSCPTILPAIDFKSLAASALSAVRPRPRTGRAMSTERELVPQGTFSPTNGDRTTNQRRQQKPPNISLPPIGSPQSEIDGHSSLPPIRSQLGEQFSDHRGMTENNDIRYEV
ncbi:hypothetical protein PG994_015346 [Apiospora phragmitis]|uniref:Uncharacterized protein n=1 Tax=Apiospora phragmitis TaxID=2905665 RepID=A0ABR1SR96_9PEZI